MENYQNEMDEDSINELPISEEHRDEILALASIFENDLKIQPSHDPIDIKALFLKFN